MNIVFRFVVALVVLVMAGCQSRTVDATPTSRILVVIADKDFYDPELVGPKAKVEELGFTVDVASPSGGTAVGYEGLVYRADLKIEDAIASNYDSIMLVGGYGAESLYGNETLIRLVQDFAAQGKPVGAQCYAPIVLAQAGLLDDIPATCWPEQGQLMASYGVNYTGRVVEQHGKVVTGISGLPQNISAFTEVWIKLLPTPQKTSAGGSPTVKDSRLVLDAGGTRLRMIHAGVERTALYYVPEGLDRSRPITLLIGIHGMNSSGENFQHTGFREVARKLNMVIAFPDGIDGQWDATPGSTGPQDDLGFFRRLITEFPEATGLAVSRVWVTGHSMGGFMTYRIGWELPDLVDAVAPAEGTFILPTGSAVAGPAKTVPILHLAAADDDIIPLAGFPGYSHSARAGLDIWKKRGLDDDDVKLVVLPKGGHAWQDAFTELIIDFLVSRVQPKLRIGGDRPKVVHSASPIQIQIESDSPRASLRNLRLVSGQEVLALAGANGDLVFTPRMNSLYALDVYAGEGADTLVSSNRWNLVVVPPNIAAGAVALSSADEGDSTPARFATDGDLATRWASGSTDDQYLQIDLGAPRRLSGVTLFWEAAFGRAYKILGSADGASWAELVSVSDGGGGTEIHSFRPAEYRYLRFQGVKRATNWGYSLWEVMVH